ncbi:MAG: right-handed parallel beta-helix repeat-containing protein [Saprospiraceae bacterium]|nr:right-handed parallel beta-helix repeat-containing protein [Saprospiraceae bacterium]HRG69635.1 right-handed parallel beta-helix repeat-containing protein [Saprospiraceae bacterium]
MKSNSIVILILIPFLGISKTWLVGPGKTYTSPSAVSNLVADGDSILIDAAEYKKDVCLWKAHNLTFIGVGGYAHLNAEGTAYGGKAIWVITGNFNRLEFIEFSNCSVVDRNGAGIRLEGTSLTVSHCYFHNNQDGILAGDNPASDVVIEYTEFSHNGAGDGYSHNLYINHLRSLTFKFNYVHHAYYGHELKSRAYTNVILYNRITNEDGDASYEIDLPNGGPALIMGNVIQQSRYSDNNTLVSYGREGLTNPGKHSLYFLYNTIVNNEDKGILLNVQTGMDTLVCANNLIAGKLTLLNGIPKDFVNLKNYIQADINVFEFQDPTNYDYHLSKTSPGKDSAHIFNESFLSYELNPTHEYVHPLDSKFRYSDLHPDLGAFELQQITLSESEYKEKVRCIYREGSKQLLVEGLKFDPTANEFLCRVFSLDGKPVLIKRGNVNSNSFDLGELIPGYYTFTINIKAKHYAGSFVVFR